jgi:hypothetical protein
MFQDVGNGEPIYQKDEDEPIQYFIGSRGPEDEDVHSDEEEHIDPKNQVAIAESLGVITDVELFECDNQYRDSADSEN